MNKVKLKEILANSKDAFRVYRNEYGNVWQVIPQEEYMELVHIKEKVREYLYNLELAHPSAVDDFVYENQLRKMVGVDDE